MSAVQAYGIIRGSDMRIEEGRCSLEEVAVLSGGADLEGEEEIEEPMGQIRATSANGRP